MFDGLIDDLWELIYKCLYYLEIAFLSIVNYIEKFFNLFAGTQRVMYDDQSTYLINLLLGNSAITTAFWAMALLAITLAFFFAIYSVARKTVDFSEHVKQSTGQIMSNFFRSVFVILVLNFAVVASISITNTLLDRINYALLMSEVTDGGDLERDFTDQEYAQMAVVLSTVANFSVNPSPDQRYNANACFNAVRADLMALYVNGVFDFEYPLDENGHYYWQGALKLLVNAASLNAELTLNDYNDAVTEAVATIRKEISNYPNFAPTPHVEKTVTVSDDLDIDTIIFLITSLGAERNSSYRNGGLDDPLRQSYLGTGPAGKNGEPPAKKDYTSYGQVKKDFNMSEISYLTAYIAAIVMIIVMANIIFTFVVRMFNIAVLYIVAPFAASTMPVDDGEKFKTWVQSFVIQLFSGFGSIIAMRIYLMFIPVISSTKLQFFAGSDTMDRMSNNFARLIAILGGGWAVMQASSLISGLLSGNAGMAALQQEGAMRAMTVAGVMSAPGRALGAARSTIGMARSTASGMYRTARAVAHPVDSLKAVGQGIKDSWQSPNRRQEDRQTGNMQREMNRARISQDYDSFRNGGPSQGGSGGGGSANSSTNSNTSRSSSRKQAQSSKAPMSQDEKFQHTFGVSKAEYHNGTNPPQSHSTEEIHQGGGGSVSQNLQSQRSMSMSLMQPKSLGKDIGISKSEPPAGPVPGQANQNLQPKQPMSKEEQYNKLFGNKKGGQVNQNHSQVNQSSQNLINTNLNQTNVNQNQMGKASGGKKAGYKGNKIYSDMKNRSTNHLQEAKDNSLMYDDDLK